MTIPAIESPQSNEDAGRCPVHPHLMAVAACERCGSFMCADCRGATKTCAHCRTLIAAEPRSIGGWLYLPMLGLWLSPLLFLLTLAQVAIQVLQVGVDSALSDGGWLTYIFVDLLFALTVTGMGLYILPKFHKRKAAVPKLMQRMYALNILSHVVGIVGLGLMGELAAPADGGNPVMTTARPFIMSLIWMSYFEKSERVKQTFIL